MAQPANHIAVGLDRIDIADMSRIAAVGGDVKPLVGAAIFGRPIIAIDGCPPACCEKVSVAGSVEPERIVRLHVRVLRTRRHVDVSDDERETVLHEAFEEPELLAAADDRVPGRRSRPRYPGRRG